MGSFVKADISKEVYKAMSDIAAYDKQTQDGIRNVVREKTGEVFTLAVQTAPSRKGNLKASIKETITNTTKGAQGIVSTDDPVAHLVEFGAKGTVEIPVRKKALHPGADGWFMAKAIIPYRTPKPFMKPSIDRVRPSIEAAVKDVIK